MGKTHEGIRPAKTAMHDYCCRSDSVGSIHNLPGISIVWIGRFHTQSISESHIARLKTHPISDSFALMEKSTWLSRASLLTSAAASDAQGSDRTLWNVEWKVALTSHWELLVDELFHCITNCTCSGRPFWRFTSATHSKFTKLADDFAPV